MNASRFWLQLFHSSFISIHICYLVFLPLVWQVHLWPPTMTRKGLLHPFWEYLSSKTKLCERDRDCLIFNIFAWKLVAPGSRKTYIQYATIENLFQCSKTTHHPKTEDRITPPQGYDRFERLLFLLLEITWKSTFKIPYANNAQFFIDYKATLHGIAFIL